MTLHCGLALVEDGEAMVIPYAQYLVPKNNNILPSNGMFTITLSVTPGGFKLPSYTCRSAQTGISQVGKFSPEWIGVRLNAGTLHGDVYSNSQLLSLEGPRSHS